MAEELEKKRLADVREAANRRRICEQSEELRRLKEKLSAAAVNQARAKQLLERQILDEEDQRREAVLDAHCEASRLESADAEARHALGQAHERKSVGKANQGLIA